MADLTDKLSNGKVRRITTQASHGKLCVSLETSDASDRVTFLRLDVNHPKMTVQAGFYGNIDGLPHEHITAEPLLPDDIRALAKMFGEWAAALKD